MLALVPLRRKARVKLLWSVAAYGVAIVLFGLSTNIYLAIAALFASGAADQVGVFIRQTIVRRHAGCHAGPSYSVECDLHRRDDFSG